MKKFSHLSEDLRNWFNPSHPEGGWKRVNSKGEAIGPCAREPGEPKPKCMSNEKRAALSKKERAAAVRAKRKHDPNPERKGKPINVSNFGKGKLSEDMKQLEEKNVPTSPEKWAQAKAQAKAKFDVYPSAYANGWAAKKYKEMGGGWKSVSEAKDDREYDYEGEMVKSDLRSIIANANRLIDMLEDNTNLPEWVQSKVTVAEDYISTVANYMTAEMNEETLQEGRPSQRHPLEGHEYHKKTDAELKHIAKDAHEAAEAMKSHNTTAENKYRDQANDSATVRYWRQKHGMPDWYKKKYGHMKEETEIVEQKTAKSGVVETDVFGVKAYHSKCLEPGCKFESKRFSSMKKAQEAAKKHAEKEHFVKEEVEQIEELSTDLLGRYKKAAGAQASAADKAGDVAKGNKRFSGIMKATLKQFKNDAKKNVNEQHREKGRFRPTVPYNVPNVKTPRPVNTPVQSEAYNTMSPSRKENQKNDVPFEGPYTKTKSTVIDKSGAKHSPYSKVRDLARKAMQKQMQKKTVKESILESRKAEIVKELVKKKKTEKFDAQPEIEDSLIKTSQT